ncbi:MAG: hypothetical protein PHG64_01000 [Paludibacter sp.]|nr:hypothetical protein [Paludibacter sp.]
MIESEKFQYRGGWKLENDIEAFGKSILMVTSGGGVAADAITVFDVNQDGSYIFWSRTKDYKTQAPKTRISRLVIDETQLAEQGKHGNDGFYWEKVGVVELSKGNHVLRIRDVAANYARVDAIIFTTDEKMNPNNFSYRQLERYIKEPIPVNIEDNIIDQKDNSQKVITTSFKKINEIANNAIKIKLLQSENEILNKTQLYYNQQWVSLNDNFEDHQLFLIKAKNPGVNFSSFYTSWTGIKSKQLKLNGKSYPIFDPSDMQNPFLAGNVLRLKAYNQEKLDSQTLKIYYSTDENDTIISTWTIKDNNYYFDVTLQYKIKEAQYYSFAVGALQEMEKNDVSNVLLSPMYQFKRIPEKPNLLPLALTPQPVSIIESKGISSFITGNPDEFSRTWGNYDMGFSLKNVNNKVQPVAFAPILGMRDSYFEVGKELKKSFKIGILPLQWHNTLQYVSDSLFLVKDYRSQTTSLNSAIFRIINLIKSDEASGWEKEMRGFLDIESNPKIRTEVVQASPVGLLSASIITKDEDLYIKRALPSIEYMLSRKGFRWGFPKDDEPQTENKVNTFTPYKSEFNTSHFESLHKLLNYKNPWILDIAMPNGTPRYSKGYGVDETWTGDLAAYRLTKDEKWLVKAVIGANHLINSELYNNPSKPVYDWMFYNSHIYPQWFDLLDLYDITKNKDFFNAACYGAYFTIAGQRSYPIVKNKEIIIHKNGKYIGNANIFWKKDERFKLGYPRKDGDVQEKTINEKIVSPVGLGFEQPMTFFTKSDNLNHVFMSTWAPSLLRLNNNHKFDFFETYARNSIIGRFASYPGYYAAGYTDLPLDSIYPYKGPDVTSLYYHHIPSHLAFTIDYLITEAIQRSKAVIDFPYGKQQGFVWFNNRIYGGQKGSILHDRDVELYFKQNMIKVSTEEVNYLTGISDNNFWLVLLNESESDQTVKININTPYVKNNSNAIQYLFSQSASIVSDELKLINNELTVNIGEKGIKIISFPMEGAHKPIENKPIEKGFQSINIGKNNKLYLFRIRSPFGWDSVYGYIDSSLPKNASVKLELISKNITQNNNFIDKFPYEWTFLKIEENKPIDLRITLRDGEKVIENKKIEL